MQDYKRKPSLIYEDDCEEYEREISLIIFLVYAQTLRQFKFSIVEAVN